jgi:hypothetical protein
MRRRDQEKADAAAQRFHQAQKRLALLMAVLILFSCLIGLLSGVMWLPMGMAEHLGPVPTRVLSAGIPGITGFVYLRHRKRSAAEEERRKKARDREYEV